MEEGLEQLKKHLFSMQSLTEEEWHDLSGIWQLHQYKRKATLTAAGETERYLYFVLEGIQRAFFLDAEHEAIAHHQRHFVQIEKQLQAASYKL